jgi:hypothetical protein
MCEKCFFDADGNDVICACHSSSSNGSWCGAEHEIPIYCDHCKHEPGNTPYPKRDQVSGQEMMGAAPSQTSSPSQSGAPSQTGTPTPSAGTPSPEVYTPSTTPSPTS